MYLQGEVAGDAAQERLRVDKDMPQGEGVDAQGQVADVHKLDAQCCRQAQLPQGSSLISRRRLGNQRQVAQDALQAARIGSQPCPPTDSSIYNGTVRSNCSVPDTSVSAAQTHVKVGHGGIRS